MATFNYTGVTASIRNDRNENYLADMTENRQKKHADFAEVDTSTSTYPVNTDEKYGKLMLAVRRYK